MTSVFFCDNVPCAVWNCCIAPIVVPCYCVRQCMRCICRCTPCPCNWCAPCLIPPDLRPLYLGHVDDPEPPKPLVMDRAAEATVATRFFTT